MFDKPKPIISKEINFSDLFTVTDKNYKGVKIGLNSGKDYFVIGGYMSIHVGNQYKSLYVIPSQIVVDAVLSHMIPIEYDTRYFDVVIWDDQPDAAVYVKYNQIIGSRLLGYMPKDQILANL